MQVPVNNIWLLWKKTQKEFENNFSGLQQRIHSVAIHDIRVAMKKLRAFLHFYQLIKKEPEGDFLFHKTEQLFAILGRYRDIEICQSLTAGLEKETNGQSKEFNNYLRFLLKTTRAWANQEIHRYHKKELVRVALLLKQDVLLADTAELTHQLEVLIHEKLATTLKHFKQPHLLRKNLKEVYYWIALFPGENAGKAWHDKELHDILDDLGEWQDLEILSVRLKHFRKDYLPKPFDEYRVLKDFQTRINDKKKRLLDNARRKTRGWLKSVLENEKSEG